MYIIYVKWLFYLVIIILCGCQGINEEKNIPQSDLPSEEFIDAVVQLSSGVHHRAIMKAEILKNYSESELSKGWGLNIQFYDSIGNQIAYIIADSGIIESEEVFSLYGDILLTTPEPSSLWCKELYWEPKNELVKSDKPVRLKQRGEVIEADGLRSDINLKRIEFIGNVRGKIKDEY